MTALVRKVHNLLAASAPIVGVAIGNPDDKATWRIDFADEATPLQRLTAQTALNNFDPDAVVVEVPAAVPMMRFKIALHRAGLLSAVEAAVPSLGVEAQIAWEYAITIARSHPLVAACAAAVNVSNEQLDQLFTAAADVSPE